MRVVRCEVCLRPKRATQFAKRRIVCPMHKDYGGERVEPCEPHDREYLKLIYRPGMGTHYGCAMCYRT